MPENGQKNISFLIIYIIIWTVINLLFLVSFPFMHTDEAWLGSLTRTMMSARNPAATESFFNLVQRSPHAIKIFFHSIQAIFISTFGFSLFSVRLFSLLAGSGSLLVFSGVLKRLGLSRLPGVILLSLQVQFIYASHFARQEILILLLMLLSLYLLHGEKAGLRRGLAAGLPIAIAIGFHPNAFVAAWPAGLIFLFEILRKQRRVSEGLGFLIPPAASALLFILISLSFNNSFAANYGSFGKEVGVFDSFDIKLLGFDDFYRKLFLRVSGTYYTPRIWPVFIISAAFLLILTGQAIKTKADREYHGRSSNIIQALIPSLAGIGGINIGILIIGKYSAPSIVFIIPFLVILIAGVIDTTSSSALKRVLFLLPAVILLLNSLSMIINEINVGESYRDFTREVSYSIAPLQEGEKPDAHRVLGPLTVEFALEQGRLLDWRNLSELDLAGMTLDRYIEDNSIEYIIYTEELDLIFDIRPVWNILYGNPSVYYRQLRDYIENHCEAVSSFSSPGYGTRIVMHRFNREWKVVIYRVIE